MKKKILAILLILLMSMSCSTMNRASELASTTLSASAEAAGGIDGSALVTALTALLSGIRDLMQPEREFWLSLAIALDNLDMLDQAAREGLPAAVLQLCLLPGPDDIPLDVDVFNVSQGDSGEVGTLRVTGVVGENELPVDLTIEVGPDDALLHLRGGGWLLCGLARGNIELDGEPLYLGEPEETVPELTVNAWPQDFAETGHEPHAVEIDVQLRVDHEVVEQIISAEHVSLILGAARAELYPENSTAMAELVQWFFAEPPVAQDDVL